MTIVLGDFNAKSNNWCKFDITSLKGSKIDTIANSYGLNQLIQEPTHILNSSSSCIDLIFTSQPNLVMESGIHSSLHSNCHHQIVFAKFNLSIFYPPPYETAVWYYERASTELIRRAIISSKEFGIQIILLFQQKHVPFRKIQSLTVSTEHIYRRIEREVLH